MQTLTELQKFEVYLDYKISQTFKDYDLLIYDLSFNEKVLPNNTIWRNDLKSKKWYKTLNVSTIPYCDKSKTSSFEEFCNKTSDEYKRTRNYIVGNVYDWYNTNKEKFNF